MNMQICGFDYGTSNCALGAFQNSGASQLLKLEGDKVFLPSTLYAIARELICESVGLGMNGNAREDYIAMRAGPLANARRVRSEEGFLPDEQTLFFGREAFDQYFSLPEEGYFVKSPKSFLGASGLRPQQVGFFEDIVTAMMLNVKSKADAQLSEPLTHTVIGRPVNFQGLNAEKSNQQALEILTVAAKRAGFKEVEFLYEPIAAGLHFEQQLTDNKTVIVVDIGGGTTDCAVVRMGPDYRKKDDRRADFIGHTGERVGGNDLDIQMAGNCLLPLFGSESQLKSGKPVPLQVFLNAVTTNDVSAQADFNSMETGLLLKQLLRDSRQPELLKRFIKLYNNHQNNQLVRSAEQSKIALSDKTDHQVDLAYVEQALNHSINFNDMAEAVERPVSKMISLIDDALAQAGSMPDLVYVTGGSAQSPVIQEAIRQRLPGLEVVDGDHFGSVASGLTVWSQRVFN
ncbi:molecular chaperone [Endozoicomonas sp. OPT23]|uniref:molecular chaperone n=1 Tax=Endozoicomonas sp. OPT23 TaxID=2072845 RepID=UPI001E58383D|nr:molecular chaperone [Endozoicomonas sp. OPT23]